MGVENISRAEDLRLAFADFEVASRKLSSFYGNLERRVAQLNEELSDSRAAEMRQLREKELIASRLKSLLDALPAGVVVLDGHGRVVEINPAAAELLGRVATGEPWIAVVQRTFNPQWDDGHDVSLRDGRRVNIATEALGAEPGQILLIKDVTETRRLQELLEEHRRLSAKTELAAGLAHQIRTPLATAMLHTANFSNPTAQAQSRQRASHNAMHAMRQLERLVDNMLTYARGEQLGGKPFAIHKLLDRFQRSLDGCAATEFTVTTRRSDEAMVIGNEDALLSILLNLIDNGRAATGGRGCLDVVQANSGTGVTISVTDDGPGVPPAQAGRIFEPFFTTKTNGTGLGLAVARSVARAHGGDLNLDTAYRGGARFILSLAGADAAPESAPREAVEFSQS